MTRRIGRLGHCYRCIYTWRIRSRGQPSVCPRCKSRLWRVPKIRPLRTGSGLGIEEVIRPHRAELLRLRRKYGAARLWVFGSVRRNEAGPESDVDLMVEWGRSVSFLAKAGLGLEIEKVLGRHVDLVNAGSLHWAIAPQVEAEKVEI
jgi:uncharacterized protein